MQTTSKRFAQQLGVLLAAFSISAAVQAVEPPAGTITELDNVGAFDGSTNVLTSCVALQDANGAPLLDASGKARVYEATLSLNRATLVFKVTAATPWTSTKKCSGVYKSGVYTDSVLIANLGPAYNGKVWNLTLDVLNANLEFRLRLDSSFSAMRTFAGNTTQLGSDLGDFQNSTTREYTTSTMPTLVTFKLPQCSDPQGDENRAVIVKDGAVLASGMPGGNYGWSTSGVTAGEYQFQAHCSDEVGIRQLAASKGLAFSPSYIANSANAAGTVRVKVTQATTATNAGELTFNFAATTSASDQTLIRETALFVRDFLWTTLGRTLEKATTVTTSGASGGCANPGAAAFAGPQSITICTSNQGWTIHGSVNKKKIMIHEMFHILQYELRWIGAPTSAGPHWLAEGSAEYIGWLGVASLGHVTLDTARGCMAKEVADYAPGMSNLSAYENGGPSFGPGPVYPLSMLGTDQLVTSSSVKALLNFGAALATGTNVASSFQTAFGRSQTDFYAQFPAYRTGLAVPSTYLCRI